MDHGDEEIVDGGVCCGGGVMAATATAISLEISKSHDIMFAEQEDADDALLKGTDAVVAAGRKDDRSLSPPSTSSSGSDGEEESSNEDSSSSGDNDDDDDDGDNNKENSKQRSGDDNGPSEYEKLRLANIQRNRERLAMLGLLPLDDAERRKQPATTSTKRKRDQSAFIPRRSLPRRRCAKIRHLPSTSPTTAAIVPSRQRVSTDAVSHRKAAAVVASSAVPAGGTTIFDDYDNHNNDDDDDENESVPSPVPITRTLKPQPHQATVDESHLQAYLKTRRVRRGRPKREEYDYGCDEVCAHCGGEWQFNNDYCLRPGSTCLTLAADDGDIEDRTRLIRCKDCRGAFHLECMRIHGKEEVNTTIGDLGAIVIASQSTRDPIRCYRCDVQQKASRLSADSASSSLLSSTRPFLLEAVIGDRTLMIRVTPEPVLEATIRVVKSDLELEAAVDDKHIMCSVTFGKETMPEPSETEDEEDDEQLEDDVKEFMQGADANAIQTLISNNLSNFNDSQTQDDSFILLRSFIKTEASAVAIVRMNGIQMLSKTLRLHPDQPTSLAEAISTLAEIAWASPKKGGEAIIQCGTSCLDLTLAALVRHPVDAMVQQMACGLFRALSYNPDCCAELNSKRVVSAVVDSIRRNTEELDLVMEARFV